MVTCAIVGCHNKQGIHLGVRFFGVPTVITNQCAKTMELSRRRRAEWIARINRKDITENTARKHHKVCGKHFVQGCPSSLFATHNQDWLPSRDLGYENPPENRNDGRLPLDEFQPQNQNGADHLDSLLEISCGSSSVPEENQTIAQCGTGAEHLDSQQEDPLFVSPEVLDFTEEKPSVDFLFVTPEMSDFKEEKHSVDTLHLVSMNSDVPEEKAVESVNLSCVKMEDDVSDEPSAMDMSAQTCTSAVEISVRTSQQLTDTSVQACPAVTDASVQACTCRDEFNELRMERDALGRNVVSLNAELSESAYKVELFGNSLAEKNLILAEKNIKLNDLEAKIKMLETSYLSCLKTCDELKSSTSKVFLNEDSFKNDDKKVSYYTGLPTFAQLMLVYNLVSEKVKDSGAYAVPKFQQFLMVLMWLRLGLEQQDLAYRFNVTQGTVSRILYRWFIPMSHALESFVVWPDRETLQTSMPQYFQENSNNEVAVIIDCFEVFVRSPSSFVPRAGIKSQCKHDNTVKFLIGTTPQGRVSFISKSWVGRTSDKHILQHCGLLDKLLPGDIVMADRNINDAESLVPTAARLTIPDFTTGKPQLSFDDLELTRKIANFRNHLERVIGLVRRKYQILCSQNMSVKFLTKTQGDDLTPIDHVARVCCALTNFCPPVVPLE